MQSDTGSGAAAPASVVHKPVMLAEILELFETLGPSAALAVDCTLGAGGHAEALLSRFPALRYIGIDADPEARARAAARLAAFSARLEIRGGYFDEALAAWASESSFKRPDFILFDLGVSTYHYFDSNRGFSFFADEPLDMRFSPEAETTAADLVNGLKEEELADLIYQYGEERYSRKIAKTIVEARRKAPVRTSLSLASLVSSAVPPAYRHGRIHPATRTFQALRIKVNAELERAEKALRFAADMLAPGGILAVIAYHSLEDRIVKLLCREYAKTKAYEALYKTPRRPSDEECAVNPAARSAKLRALRAPLAARLAAAPVGAASTAAPAGKSGEGGKKR